MQTCIFQMMLIRGTSNSKIQTNIFLWKYDYLYIPECLILVSPSFLFLCIQMLQCNFLFQTRNKLFAINTLYFKTWFKSNRVLGPPNDKQKMRIPKVCSASLYSIMLSMAETCRHMWQRGVFMGALNPWSQSRWNSIASRCSYCFIN